MQEGQKNQKAERLAVHVTETARQALKNVVVKGTLPWPQTYSEEFWSVARACGYDDILFKKTRPPEVSVQAVDGFLEQADRILSGVSDTVHSFVTGSKVCREGMAETIHSIDKQTSDSSPVNKEIQRLIAINKELEEHTARTEEQLKSQQELIKDLQAKLKIDPLTKLFNRRSLEVDLKKELAKARRYNYPLSLIMADLDKFKEINDSHGHQIGDRVLQKIARMIRDCAREVDTVYRYGGEEFLIMLPHTTGVDAVNLAERVRLKVARHIFTDRKACLKLNITLSLGVAQFVPGDSVDDLVLRADKALYKAKATGRNKVVRI